MIDDDEIRENQILRKGRSFAHWKAILMLPLIEQNCVGHVFHDVAWAPKVVPPTRATYPDDASYMAKLKEFWEKDCKTFVLILDNVDPEIVSNFHCGDHTTAKELMDHVELVAAIHAPVGKDRAPHGKARKPAMGSRTR